MQQLYPFRFEPVYQDYIWGGRRIGERFKRAVGRCAESWEVADLPEGMSRVSEGRLRGKTLHDLVLQEGERLLGKGRSARAFPLLLKIIDAKETLSVQVHPSVESAETAGGEPKTECWYVLEGGPVYAGFKRPVSEGEFVDALKRGAVQDLLQKIETRPHDLIFIPGGRIHAIGAGCMMLEVQQSSNTTYRLYDWGRMGLDGKPRQLHIEQALHCIKWDDDNDPRKTKMPLGEGRFELLSTLFFCVEELVSQGEEIKSDPGTFQIFFDCKRGKTALLPARSEPLFLDKGPFIRVYLPAL